MPPTAAEIPGRTDRQSPGKPPLMRRPWRQMLIPAGLLALAIGCAKQETPAETPVSPSPAPRRVAVAAAADLKFALDDIVAAFRRQQPGIDVQPNYGSSGSFFAQLSNQAPFDLFLSADLEYPRKLVEQGLADEASVFQYAVGRIVVWAPNDSRLEVTSNGLNCLLDPNLRKIAIANPTHAPYGRAAEAAMKSLGVYEAAQPRLVFGENVAQTAQFIESGAADVGIIALSLAVAPPMRDKGRYGEVPLDAYPRMEQGGVILRRAQDRAAAEEFKAFLLGPESRSVLKEFGFFLPED